MREKIIDWAYASSEHAVKNGFGRTGCYVLEVIGNGEQNKVHGFFATRSEAVSAGNKLPEAWHPITAKENAGGPRWERVR